MRLSAVGLALLVAGAGVGAGACAGGGSSGTTTTVAGAASTLPLPAANPPPSTLQFRAVLGDAADCPPVSTNPPAGEPTSMLRQNQCLSLAPAGLVVRKADVIAVQGAGGPVVRVTLRGDDVSTFTTFSQDYVGRTIALVAFGKVLSAPRLNEPISTGRLDISGLTQNEAADLKAALG